MLPKEIGTIVCKVISTRSRTRNQIDIEQPRRSQTDALGDDGDGTEPSRQTQIDRVRDDRAGPDNLDLGSKLGNLWEHARETDENL